MAAEATVDPNEMARSISFEVEAVPQDNTLMLISTASSTPLKVKIKVRKKKEAKNVQNAIVSLPKFARSGSKPGKIRLANSDQTILSFNIFTEDEQPIKKSFLKMIKKGHCFESSADTDDDQYVKSAPKLIHRYSTCSRSENVLAKNASAETAECAKGSGKNLNRGVLGNCKPGGCLDPPFGEDKYSYDLVKSNQAPAQWRHDIKIVDNNTSVNTENTKTKDIKESNSKKEISDNSETPNRQQIEYSAIHVECNDDDIPKNSSFEVKTRSQDETLQMTSIADRPNKEGDVKKSRESLARNSSAQERIRLASSEQRIMSNVCIKHQDEKRISQTSGALYHFKNMFKSGNSPNKSDEEHQSVIDTSTALKLESSSSPTERRRFKEKKTKKGVFGKCKPGGCLDRTCGQDGNAYELVKPEAEAAHATVKVVTNDYPINTILNNTDSNGNNATKKKSDVTQPKPKIKIELNNSASLLSIFQSNKINDSYSSSIITYPPVLTTSEMQVYDEKNMKNRNSLNSYTKSFQVSHEIYFPKKANTDKKTFNPNGDIIGIPSNSNLKVTRMNYSYLRAFDTTASSSGGQTNVEISVASTSDDLLERTLTNFDITVENIRPTFSSANKTHKKSFDSLKMKLSNEGLSAGINDMNGSVFNNDSINQVAISEQIKFDYNLSSRSSKLIQSKDDERRNVNISPKHIERHQSTIKVNEDYGNSQSNSRLIFYDQEDEKTKIIIGDEKNSPEIQKNYFEAPNIRKSSILLHKSKYVLPEHRDVTTLNKLSDFAIIDNTSEPIKDAETVTDDGDDNNNTQRVNTMQSFSDHIADLIKGEEQGSDKHFNFNKENKDVSTKTTSSFPYQKTHEQETTEYDFTNSSIQRENIADVDVNNCIFPNKYSDLHTTQSSSKTFTSEKIDSKSPKLMNRSITNSQTNPLGEIGVAYNEESYVYGKIIREDKMEAFENLPQELPIYHNGNQQADGIGKKGDEMNYFPRISSFDTNNELENKDDVLNNLNEHFIGALVLQNTLTTDAHYPTVRHVEQNDTINDSVKYIHQIERDILTAQEREHNDLNKAIIPSKTNLEALIKSDTNISINSKFSKENSQGSISLNSVEISLNSKVQALKPKNLDHRAHLQNVKDQEHDSKVVDYEESLVNSKYNTPRDIADLDDSHEPNDFNLELKHVNYDPQNLEFLNVVKQGSLLKVEQTESLRNSEEPQPIQKYFDDEKHKPPSVFQKESNHYNHSKGFPITTEQQKKLNYLQIRNDHSSKENVDEDFLHIPREQLDRSDNSQIPKEYKRTSKYIDNEEFPEIQKQQPETLDYTQIQKNFKHGSKDLDNEDFPEIPKGQLEISDYSQIQNEYKRNSKDLDNVEFPGIPKEQQERSFYSPIQNEYKRGSKDLYKEEIPGIPKGQPEISDYSQIKNEYKRNSKDFENFPGMPKEQLERSDYFQIQNMYKHGSRDYDNEEFPGIPKEQREKSNFSQFQNEFKRGSRDLDYEEFPRIPKEQLERSDYSQIQNDYKRGSKDVSNEEFTGKAIKQSEISNVLQIQNDYTRGSKDFDNEEVLVRPRDEQENSDYSQSSIKSKYSYNVGDTDVVKEQQFIDPVDYLQGLNESDSSESFKISEGQRDFKIVTPLSAVTSLLNTKVSKESSDNIKSSFLLRPSSTNKALDTTSTFTKVQGEILDDESGSNLHFHGYKEKYDSSGHEKYLNELKSVNATDSRHVGGDSKEALKTRFKSRQETFSRKTVTDEQTILDENNVIVVDIALQRFLNKQGERVIKSVDSATVSDRDDHIVTIKSTIQPGRGITASVDKEHYLTLTLSKRQINTVIPVTQDEIRTSGENQLKPPFQQSQPRIETGELQNVSEAKKTSRNFQCSGPLGQASVVTIPQRTLSTVYELQLVPLQKVIRTLKDEIDQLAKQQELLRQRLTNRRLEIAKVTNFGKTCGGCLKKT